MSLTITDTVLDEEFRPILQQTGTGDDDDVASSSFIDAAVTALSLTTLSGFTGFPQFAESVDFVTSSNSVTDYYLTLSSDGVGTDLYVGGNRVFLYATDNPDVVVGRIGTGTTANASGAIALIIAVDDSDLDAPNLWMAQFAPFAEGGLDQMDAEDPLDLSGLISLGSTYSTLDEVPFENFNGVAPGNNLFNVIFPSDGSDAVQLLLTGSKGETLSTVNVSSTGIGAGSQHISVGSTLRIDTVTGMNPDNVDKASEVNNSGNIDYTDRVEIIAADFEVTQVNPSSTPERVDIIVSAFNTVGAAQEGAYLTDALATDGASVQIDAADVRILNDAGDDITAAWLALPGTDIIQVGDTVKILGLNDGASNSTTDGDRVAFTTDGVHFDRFLITNVDSSTTLDVANIHVTAEQGGSDDESGDLGEHLIFEDDGPVITASGIGVSALVVDESDFAGDATGSFAGLFNAPDYGADVPAASTLQYTMGISATGALTNLVQTSSGDSVFLFLESGVVVGRAGDDAAAAASGAVVFQISVDADGLVTLDQQDAVVHPTNPDQDESTAAMTASLITITATVTDGEAADHNDSASAVVNVGDRFLFEDDGPSIDPSADPNAPNDLEVKNMGGAPGHDSSAFVLTPGNDGQKSFSIVGPADATGLFTWSYFDVDGSGTAGTDEIKGFYDGDELYTLEINPDGSYDFQMIGTLPSSSDSLNTKEIKAGAPDTNSIEVGATSSTDFVRITADSTVGGGFVNESHGFVGVDNGNLDGGESLTLTYYDENGGPLTFEGLVIGTKSAQGGFYAWSAVLADGVTVINGPAGGEFVGKNGALTVDPANYGALSSITVTKMSGPATKIGLGDIQILLLPDDVQLGFTVALTDGDNDPVTANFVVDIDGDNDGDFEASMNSFAAINPDAVQVLGFEATHGHHDILI
ncbi:MAG: DUF5801 repeats-in-toxin domain-containing protein [Sphingomicrobium sp.]